MTKATHNGTCQACGRSQAHAGTMAKHGYTTTYGYFNGTCSGSDRPALELETSHNVAAVAAIRKWADEQDAKADGEILKITVSVRNPEYVARSYMNRRIDVQMTREDYIEAKIAGRDDMREFTDVYSREFDGKVESIRFNLHRAATSARKDADDLEALRAATFGNDLIERNPTDAPKSHRESFSATKGDDGRWIDRANAQAYDRQRELKEQGIRSRVTGDARYATITFKK